MCPFPAGGRAAIQSPITPTPLILAPPLSESAAVSGFSLHLEHNRLVLEFTVNIPDSKLTLRATPSSPPHKDSKRRAARPVLIASLSRANLPAGALTLDVPLNPKTKLTREHAKRVKASVKITLTPPSGQPETLTDVLTI